MLMTDKDILRKAIEKLGPEAEAMLGALILVSGVKDFKTVVDTKLYYRIIFSHDFAKAFWGEKIMDGGYVHFDKFEGDMARLAVAKLKVESWKYHLQQMVIEEEPLSYLKKFL